MMKYKWFRYEISATRLALPSIDHVTQVFLWRYDKTVLLSPTLDLAVSPRHYFHPRHAILCAMRGSGTARTQRTTLQPYPLSVRLDPIFS
jgi:hypothetical protein